MAHNFHPMNDCQTYLLPPDMRDWLPEGHLAWFIKDAIALFDLRAFYKDYRADGVGNTAYHPQMMLAVLVYAYCNGVLSSRKIAMLCEESVPYRVLSCDRQPEFNAIARFRKRHLKAFQALFVEVLRLCAEAGLVKVGKVAVDGTKVKANASLNANRTEDGLAKQIAELMAQAEAKDQEEDQALGETKRGDELPEGLSRRDQNRLDRLQACKKRLEEEKKQAEEDAREKAEERARKEAEAAAEGKKLRGRKPGAKKKDEEDEAGPKANPTDPESRVMKETQGFVQSFNMQAAVDNNQIVLAAEVTQECNDQAQLKPMLAAAASNLSQAGVAEKIGLALADAGYCNETTLEEELPVEDRLLATRNRHKMREAVETQGPAPKGSTPREAMDHRLRTPEGKADYKRRGALVENRFGVAKSQQNFRMVSGRGLAFAQGEWRLVCAAMNLKRAWLLKAGLN